MLGSLRDRRGRPNTRVRLAAALIVTGMLAATAPVVVGPVVVAGWRSVTAAVPSF